MLVMTKLQPCKLAPVSPNDADQDRGIENEFYLCAAPIMTPDAKLRFSHEFVPRFMLEAMTTRMHRNTDELGALVKTKVDMLLQRNTRLYFRRMGKDFYTKFFAKPTEEMLQNRTVILSDSDDASVDIDVDFTNRICRHKPHTLTLFEDDGTMGVPIPDNCTLLQAWSRDKIRSSQGATVEGRSMSGLPNEGCQTK